MPRAKKPERPITLAQKRRVRKTILSLAESSERLDLRLRQLKKEIDELDFFEDAPRKRR
jgi:hypothetical protein